MFHNPKYFRGILGLPVRFGGTTKAQDLLAAIFSACLVYKILVMFLFLFCNFLLFCCLHALFCTSTCFSSWYCKHHHPAYVKKMSSLLFPLLKLRVAEADWHCFLTCTAYITARCHISPEAYSECQETWTRHNKIINMLQRTCQDICIGLSLGIRWIPFHRMLSVE